MTASKKKCPSCGNDLPAYCFEYSHADGVKCFECHTFALVNHRHRWIFQLERRRRLEHREPSPAGHKVEWLDGGWSLGKLRDGRQPGCALITDEKNGLKEEIAFAKGKHRPHKRASKGLFVVADRKKIGW